MASYLEICHTLHQPRMLEYWFSICDIVSDVLEYRKYHKTNLLYAYDDVNLANETSYDMTNITEDNPVMSDDAEDTVEDAANLATEIIIVQSESWGEGYTAGFLQTQD